jgi:hypothetical protein
VAALSRHSSNPKGLTWLTYYVELLGHMANRSDAQAIAVVEALLPISGAPTRVEHETLDPHNLPWPTGLLAERKGVPPGTPMKRISYIPTGLVDIAIVKTALERIRNRSPMQ